MQQLSSSGFSKWREIGLRLGCQIDQNTNKFWELVGDVIGEDLRGMQYAARLQTLLVHHVGLWDVVAEAKREGSLDSKIRDHAGNDLLGLIESLPNLVVIAFNGGTAERMGLKALGRHGDRHHVLRLPSSSPAHTAPYSEKLQVWRQLRSWLDMPD
ncbi:DNA-deoxyinosine glycosylase [Ralstonia soli]|uniref:DNA-deoxyinosine glycosylase n=1 Tax=Ralstonia soli TaxID=2953896 RepID=A0ABT1AJE2_9RALS|nr:DNA-deoxyinosine glycosylase [Ralstonia soli]MCO5398237.1 DNA-deoxyinosine glycosylase [Ralstonia soli]